MHGEDRLDQIAMEEKWDSVNYWFTSPRPFGSWAYRVVAT
jgi:hypothetical protein